MSKLSIVDRTKLNMSSVTVLIAGGAVIETDMLMQVFAGFGTGRLLRAEQTQQITKVIDEAQVELLVLDLKLGIQTAGEVMAWLRRQAKQLKAIPVLLVGSYITAETMDMLRDSGVNYVVTKPITPQVLFERLVWVARERRQFIECDSYAGPDRRVHVLGPPQGTAGRRKGDLPAEIGDASTPNMSQADIDAMMASTHKPK